MQSQCSRGRDRVMPGVLWPASLAYLGTPWPVREHLSQNQTGGGYVSCIHHYDMVPVQKLQSLSYRHWLHEIVLKELLSLVLLFTYSPSTTSCVSCRSRRISPKFKAIKMIKNNCHCCLSNWQLDSCLLSQPPWQGRNKPVNRLLLP